MYVAVGQGAPGWAGGRVGTGVGYDELTICFEGGEEGVLVSNQ